MFKYSGNDSLHFKTVNNRNVILNMKKNRGCLRVSIGCQEKSFSYKMTIFPGFALFVVLLGKSLLNPSYIVCSVLLLLYILYQLLFSIKEETVLIVKGLGYQICKTFLIRKTTTFIPYERVQRLFINEVILRHKVIYILSLLVQEGSGQPKLVPLFTDTLPRLRCLELIYRNIKEFDDS